MSNIFGLQTKSESVEIEQAKTTRITQNKVLLEDKSNAVIKKILAIALNDDHPKQWEALKWGGDRMLPMTEFDKEGKGGIKTVIIDRSCGGKVVIKVGDNTVEMDEGDYSESLIEDGYSESLIVEDE